MNAPGPLERRNARSGMVLFVIYVVFYAGFVILTAFAPKVMAMDVAGVTMSILYGFGLILLAFVLAMIYMLICRGNARDDARDGGRANGLDGTRGNTTDREGRA